jgi:murein DD-endopeptidase MepM/ murein hydrolase activator NlpD
MSAFLTHRPAVGRLIQGFGPRPKPTPTSPGTHYGEDYGWTIAGNSPIYAAADGVVKSVAAAGAYGLRTVIDHGGGRETWYCHQRLTSVKKGQRVFGGQRIGTMGATGNTVGVHLHFEVRINGTAANPALHFGAATGTLTPASTSKTPLVKPEQEEDPVFIRIVSPGRGWALIGPGYFRSIAAGEEQEQSKHLYTKTLEGNDRQFDVWKSLALDGAK